MLSAIKNFLEALTLILKALEPLIRERVREAKLNAIKKKYTTRRDAFARAIASGDANRIAAEWASFDDELLSEGITPFSSDHRGERDTENAGWELSGNSGMDGETSTNRVGTEVGAESMRVGVGSPPHVVDFDGGPML